MTTIRSPLILSAGWGRLEVEQLGCGKDFKLWPGGGRAWDWRETGTSHSAGIQIADVEELLDHHCQVIVLGRGMFSRLNVARQTLDYLQGRQVETVVASTRAAVKSYNEYAGRQVRVGGLFHSTC